MSEKTDWSEIDDYLRRADASFDAGVIGQAIVTILMRHRHLTPVDIEARLRALGSETFLTTRPASDAPNGLSIARPHIPGYLPYWLWIGLHGIDERKSDLAEMGISEEENMARLSQAGFLVIDGTPEMFKHVH